MKKITLYNINIYVKIEKKLQIICFYLCKKIRKNLTAFINKVLQYRKGE